jgi:hypothetical protein
MLGGGFEARQGGTTVVSDAGGVFIYNTTGPSSPAGDVNLANGNTDVSLAAPTTGDFAGVVLYQQRGLTNPITISGGNAARVLDGLVYAPDALFFVKGGTTATTTIGGALVVGGVDLQGSANLEVQNPSTPVPTQACQTFAYVPISWQDF